MEPEGNTTENVVLRANWSSSTYPKMRGVCEFRLAAQDSDQVSFELVFSYSSDSQFRAGKKRIFSMSGVRRGTEDNARIIAQSTLESDQQILVTLSFDKPIVSGFYASVIPIDCGALKPIEPKNKWREAFRL